MKSFKIKLFVCLLFYFSISVKSQNLETVKVYYDYARTQIKEVYTVKKGSGIKQGIYQFYDEDRMLILEIPYTNNLKNGVAKFYCTAGRASLELKPMLYYGKLEHSITYKDDELDGSYKTYNYDTGKQILKFDRVWSNGELIKDIEYYSNGNKKELKQKMVFVICGMKLAKKCLNIPISIMSMLVYILNGLKMEKLIFKEFMMIKEKNKEFGNDGMRTEFLQKLYTRMVLM